ncbi:putative transposase [Rhodococcus opacus B4]|uniref:Putative transposase n=1 Tax=Rhodococcus opacus (strain B4) TaxID=632772 RepID=C1ASI4_RHOOB|nr:putative transposase [Rhodococcus opacus B4]
MAGRAPPHLPTWGVPPTSGRITEPGLWMQFDWGEGPKVPGAGGALRSTLLFCAWLAWSRYRVVIPVGDQTLPTLIACLGAPLRCGADLRVDRQPAHGQHRPRRRDRGAASADRRNRPPLRRSRPGGPPRRHATSRDGADRTLGMATPRVSAGAPPGHGRRRLVRFCIYDRVRTPGMRVDTVLVTANDQQPSRRCRFISTLRRNGSNPVRESLPRR